MFCSDNNVAYNVTFVKTIMAFSQVSRAVRVIILAKGKADVIIQVNICEVFYTVSETLPYLKITGLCRFVNKDNIRQLRYRAKVIFVRYFSLAILC